MLGYNHAASGLALGLATLPLVPAPTPGAQAAWVIGLGGAALLVDFDTSTSTAARMWGPPTRAVGKAIGKVTGGHRQGTHDLVLAPAALWLIGTAAATHTTTMAVVLTILVGLALCGLSMSTGQKTGALINLAISLTGTWWLITSGADYLTLLPHILALGAIVHILGDMLTTEGIPLPVLWLFGYRQRISLHLFATGHTIETLLIGPALTLTTLYLLNSRLALIDLAQTFLTAPIT